MRRVALLLFAVGSLLLLALEVYVIADLRSFEYQPLLQLMGWQGLAFFVFLNAGLILTTWQALRSGLASAKKPAQWNAPARVFFALWVAAVLWLLEWTFMERPLTVIIAEWWLPADASEKALSRSVALNERRGDLTSLLGPNGPGDRKSLAVMLDRIRVNAPAVLKDYPVGAAISHYANKYGVNPVLLTHWAYMTSFSGEAPSGPMPFFKSITAEGFRDLIQAHLPWWMVESRTRQWLVTSAFLEEVSGAAFGAKLRYALHKATYDISQDPFSANTFCDVFTIMRQYPDQFPELSPDIMPADPLGRSFRSLKHTEIGQPLADPYSHGPFEHEYYKSSREDLISFTRALLYRLRLDFDFATRVQALVARYYADQYAAHLGETWELLAEHQRVALIVMGRDVYIPNIGRLSSSLYALPELNWGGFRYLAEEAKSAGNTMVAQDSLWRPHDTARLWSGGGWALRVLSETWDIMTGNPLPGIGPDETIGDGIKVLARNYSD